MVTISQVKRGLLNYADIEILSKMPSGIKKIAVGAALSLYVNSIDNVMAHPVIKTLGIIDENGYVNVDALADAVRGNIPEVGAKVDIDVLGIHLGDMILRREDIDMIKSAIMSA